MRREGAFSSQLTECGEVEPTEQPLQMDVLRRRVRRMSNKFDALETNSAIVTSNEKFSRNNCCSFGCFDSKDIL